MSLVEFFGYYPCRVLHFEDGSTQYNWRKRGLQRSRKKAMKDAARLYADWDWKFKDWEDFNNINNFDEGGNL